MRNKGTNKYYNTYNILYIFFVKLQKKHQM